MASDRLSFTDTLSGYDPEQEDRVEAALSHLDAAMARLERSLGKLKERSEPPPPDPGAPGGAMKAAA